MDESYSISLVLLFRMFRQDSTLYSGRKVPERGRRVTRGTGKTSWRQISELLSMFSMTSFLIRSSDDATCVILIVVWMV